jgi:hypothetical protein
MNDHNIISDVHARIIPNSFFIKKLYAPYPQKCVPIPHLPINHFAHLPKALRAAAFFPKWISRVEGRRWKAKRLKAKGKRQKKA